jgi:hypothetical protein
MTGHPCPPQSETPFQTADYCTQACPSASKKDAGSEGGILITRGNDEPTNARCNGLGQCRRSHRSCSNPRLPQVKYGWRRHPVTVRKTQWQTSSGGGPGGGDGG